MFILGFITGGGICLVIGWLIPPPLAVTNWWKRLIGQKEIEQKH